MESFKERNVESFEPTLLHCVIPHCKIPVTEFSSVKKLPVAEPPNTSCRNEYYFHDHESGTLYKTTNPYPEKRFK
jgi:hypothetical protein